MSRDTLFDIASTVQRLARPDLKTKVIIAAVRREHPGASKKDVVKAAFYARDGDSQQALHLRDE